MAAVSRWPGTWTWIRGGRGDAKKGTRRSRVCVCGSSVFFASPFDLAGRSERPITGLGWRDAVASRGHVLEACPRGAFVEKCFFLFLGCW